jgi:hypothetical protein
VRTEPLKALVIGAFVRGLWMRDVESLCEQAGLGKLSKSTASRICEQLRERFQRFKRRDLYRDSREAQARSLSCGRERGAHLPMQRLASAGRHGARASHPKQAP